MLCIRCYRFKLSISSFQECAFSNNLHAKLFPHPQLAFEWELTNLKIFKPEKESIIMKEQQLVKRLDGIEREIIELKILVSGDEGSMHKKPVSLKGALSGIKISEKDISEAKKSLFRLS